MPKITYESRKFRTATIEIVYLAEEVISEYESQGYNLTLRQLYYQFIARDLFPDDWFDPKAQSKNCEKNYNKLGRIISQARLAGHIDWDAIVDLTRNVIKPTSWDNPTEILDNASDQYQEDPWQCQPRRVEVWIEKEALTSVISRICEQLRVPYFACRGYTSQSAQWRAARRIANYQKPTLVLHLGDHDPSGIDMKGQPRASRSV